MSDIQSIPTRRHRRAWERAIRRLAKRAARHAGLELRPSALLPLIALVVAPGALALPAGGQVVNGNVSISTPAANTMAITQGSQKGIVNWNSFSIGASETVNIAQPSAQAVLLNRVVGSEASTIAGRLNANGQVFLVNPAGVLFARGASVNVGSLVASTLGISDADFLAGKYHFLGASPNGGGRVVNQGSITAGERGTVALLGAQVDNSGTVSAKLGTVAMGAGSDITLDFAGDGLTMLKVDGAAAQALASNSGVLQADGGQVLMSVQTADALAATVLNQTGTVRAQSVAERNGRIVLDGGAAGVTEVAGGVDATGGAGLKGGNIDVTGYHVAVNDGARIDASGAAGGGRVRVGGGAAGKATDIHNADAVWMGPAAQVRADALVNGDGGNVVVYGTNAARVYGTLTAKGGAQGGNGGLIETSARFLDVAGATIDASALHGVGGTWVLDPYDVTIVSSTIDSGGGPVFTPTQADTVITTGTIEGRLNSGTSVTINTGSGGAQLGDITLEGQIDKSAGGAATLTLDAAHSIYVDRTARASAGASITSESVNGNGAGPLNIVLRANGANSNDGTAVILLRGSDNGSLALSSNGGDISIGQPAANGGTPRVAIDHVDIDTRTHEVVGFAGSDGFLAIGTNSPSGAITINGSAPVDTVAGVAGLGIGVSVQNLSTFETTTGAVTITGDGVRTGASVDASTITTTAGAISIGGTSTGGLGAQLIGTLATGSGAIALSGVGTTGGISLGLESITTTGGNVSLSGVSAAGAGVAMTTSSISSGAGAVSLSGVGATNGVSLNTASISSTTGNVDLAGVGATGVSLQAASVTSTGTGNLSLTGSSLAGTGITMNAATVGSNGGVISVSGVGGGPAGISLTASGITSTTGAVSLAGVSGAGEGISLGASSLQSGSGAISVSSVGETGGLSLDAARITSTTGDISVQAVAATGTGATMNASTLQSGGAIKVTGSGSVAGMALDAAGITTTGTGTILLNGTSPAGVGVAMTDGTNVASAGGAITIQGQGGAGGVTAEFGSITSATGNVSIEGTALASGTVARADGVSISEEPITTGGGISIRGMAALQGPLGAGVTILSAGEGTLTLASGLPGIQISGSGNGYAGVSISNDFPAGTARTVFFNPNAGATAAPVVILGVTNGTPVPGVSGTDTLNPGVSIANTTINGSNITLAGSVTGPSAVSGLDIENSDVFARGTLTLRASNNSTTTSSIKVGGNSALNVPGGTLVLAPGIVMPGTTFTVAADDPAPISIGVAGATGPGFMLDSTFGQRFTSSIDSVYIGSNTHTGAITLGPMTCLAAPCAGLPSFRNLTAANGGVGSKGISLPSAISTIGQITLDSAGPVTQGAASLFAGSLLLAGQGGFTLTNPGNYFGALSLAGVGNSSLTSQSLPIIAFGGHVFDTRSNALVAIGGGNNATLAGNLTLTTTDGNVSSSVPIENTSGHDITLDMHATGSIRIGANVTSPTGAINVKGDATSQVIVGGVANQSGSPRISVSTNGGVVDLSAAGHSVFGSSGPTGVTGPAISLGSVDINTLGRAPNGALSGTDGAVTLQGLTPATTSFAGTGTGRPVAIDVDSATITTGSGGITLVGQSLNPVANPGNGVVLRGTPANATQLSTTTGPIRIHGTGSGFGAYGVALIGGSSITSSGSPIELLGAIAGTGAGTPSPTYGLLLLNGSINASAQGGTVSLAGSTTTADAGIAYGAVPPPPGNAGFVGGPFSVKTGAGGIITMRSFNNGAATSLLGRSGAGSIDAQGGSLVIAPASVDPSSFNVSAQNTMQITLFGVNTTQGLSIDAATYQTFSTNLQTLVLGSSTQTGRITVEGPCAGGANCAARPAVATNLTLQNTGSGSQGIDLPSGISLPANATLALDTTGAVNDPGGIRAGTLFLAGGGVFNLLDPNDVGTLVIAGARTVNFENSGSFTIGTGSANGFDAASGGIAPIGGQQGTLTGDLVAISDNGNIVLGTKDAPMHLHADGSIDLVMESTQFQNPFSATLSAGNAWRVWAKNRDGENRGGIDPGGTLPNFYGCVYNGTCAWNGQPSLTVVPGNSNHFVYVDQPTVTITVGDQSRLQGTENGPFTYTVSGLLSGDALGQALIAGPLGSNATTNSVPGKYSINGTFTSPVGYTVIVTSGTLTVDLPPGTPLEGAVFNRTGLQPLFTAQEDSFVYESNLGGINVCVGTSEPILALQQSEGAADSLAAEWKRVRSRPNLNNCLVVNGQHGCGEF
ncbi:two-partner secretion domain-containing protein [Caballeronia ptereochthonis]|uniref:Filamentous hemagglutinin outer membrane protein n=1 Tax=Caballeronia ptereochthonis TaxID=1777144 RepID=A0A157ZZX2_9BURK|nr:filamentous hemagglutinin N-terminal domain-containing protein [Caballeronia ptereochthonis]SAK51029.1 filamentous hemagglutinin outer membrane protein [Caballeronia ptereochthonis]